MRKFKQYLVYEADDPQKLCNIIDKAIKESKMNKITETLQGGICATVDKNGKQKFYQATICEEEYKPKFDF